MDQSLDNALEAARQAVEYDSKEQYKQAVYYYEVAVKLLQGIRVPSLLEKASEYQERIFKLQQLSKFLISFCFNLFMIEFIFIYLFIL